MTDVPLSYVLACLLEVGSGLLVTLACLTVVRRGPVAFLAGLAALVVSVSAGLTLAGYERHDSFWTEEWFWELTTYARAVGFAVLGIVLLLALLHSRRPGES
ncbi:MULTISPECIES: hypothetical protein [unclassified Nocardioides]|uniref:hypothetical protein n=1 Tax=unclassified Nocardioides TaxID=2615069 RepID=UPI003014DF3F